MCRWHRSGVCGQGDLDKRGRRISLYQVYLILDILCWHRFDGV